jgi:hypothetical protein
MRARLGKGCASGSRGISHCRNSSRQVAPERSSPVAWGGSGTGHAGVLPLLHGQFRCLPRQQVMTVPAPPGGYCCGSVRSWDCCEPLAHPFPRRARMARSQHGRHGRVRPHWRHKSRSKLRSDAWKVVTEHSSPVRADSAMSAMLAARPFSQTGAHGAQPTWPTWPSPPALAKNVLLRLSRRY